MPTSTPIRISCAGLVKIEIDGKILGTLNRKRFATGNFIYTPPGGSYHYHGRATKHYLEQTLGLTFQEGRDLRFTLHGDAEERTKTLEAFAIWFASRQGRELQPTRELYEELVTEEDLVKLDRYLFPSLVPLPSRYFQRLRESSDRDGKSNVLTEYFFEFFKARLNRHSRELFKKTVKERYPRVRLLTISEVIGRQTDESITLKNYRDRIPISSSFLYLI